MNGALQGWQPLVGTWAIEATHPVLPGIVVAGEATFEWLEEQRFLIQRSHFDHPQIPDAVTVAGIIEGEPCMHYFDPRGVHRVFAVEITPETWRFRNDAPRFAQRVAHTFSDRRIAGRVHHDLACLPATGTARGRCCARALRRDRSARRRTARRRP